MIPSCLVHKPLLIKSWREPTFNAGRRMGADLGFEMLCGLALPELAPLPVPLLLLHRLAHLHLLLMLLQACLDLLLVLLVLVQWLQLSVDVCVWLWVWVYMVHFYNFRFCSVSNTWHFLYSALPDKNSKYYLKRCTKIFYIYENFAYLLHGYISSIMLA